MQIRPARRRDLKAIVRIYNASIPDGLATADLEPVTETERLDWFQAHQKPGYPLLVACPDDEPHTILGWATLSSFYGRPAYDGTREVAVYVAPEAHRQGVGRTLLAALLDRAPSLQLHSVLAYIFSHNRASLHLFEQFGFETWGQCPAVARMHGQAISLTILGRTLTAAPPEAGAEKAE